MVWGGVPLEDRIDLNVIMAKGTLTADFTQIFGVVIGCNFVLNKLYNVHQ